MYYLMSVVSIVVVFILFYKLTIKKQSHQSEILLKMNFYRLKHRRPVRISSLSLIINH